MMFEAYGIRVSWGQLMNIAGFLSPSPLHPVSKTIFALSAVVAEGFDRQAAAGRNRGLARSQENKGNGRNPHLQRHQRVRCKSSQLALQLILPGHSFMNSFQTLSRSHHKKDMKPNSKAGKFYISEFRKVSRRRPAAVGVTRDRGLRFKRTAAFALRE